MATLPIIIDAGRAKAGAEKAKRSIDGVGASARRATGTTGNLSRSIRRLFLVFGGFLAIRRAIIVMADFERTMKTVQAVTRASREEFTRLNKVARELGATTRFTASQAGEGLLFLARAGFSVNDAIAALPSTLDLAIAGTLDLGRAADIASNVLSQFGLAAAEMERVADTLVITANNANTTVEQLAEALKLAGPIAGAFGRDLEETAAALGTLGDSGIQASLAGTNLRGVFTALAQPTTRAERTIRELGLTMEELNPVSNTIVEIFQRLRDAGLGAEQALAIFMRRNAAGAIILAKSVQKMEDLVKKNREYAGEARRVARIMDETLTGAFLSLVSSIQEGILQIGEAGFHGELTTGIKTITLYVRELTGIKVAFDELSKTNLNAIADFKTLSDLMTNLLLTWRKLVNALTFAKDRGIFQGAVSTVKAGVQAAARVITGEELNDEEFLKQRKNLLEKFNQGAKADEDAHLEAAASFLRAEEAFKSRIKSLTPAGGSTAPPSDLSSFPSGLLGTRPSGFDKLGGFRPPPPINEKDELDILKDLIKEQDRLRRQAIKLKDDLVPLEQQRQLALDTLDKMRNLTDEAKLGEDEYLEAVARTNAEFDARSRELLPGIRAFFRDYVAAATNAAENVRNVLVTGLVAVEDAIADVVTGAKTWGEAFKDVGRLIVRELAKIITRLTIILILESLSRSFGSGGGIGAFGSFSGTSATSGSGGAGGGFSGTGHTGAVFQGPESGYLVKLHGKEEVRKLSPGPDTRRGSGSEGNAQVVQHFHIENNITTMDAKSFDDGMLSSINRKQELVAGMVGEEFARNPALRSSMGG